ncbi:type VII secretion protein EccE [Saccharothrix coeruleofusca]|uniref:Type VII secretion protein EccE n=1 Tax=Saccharothrix coeruleofusca TaxID=33919 RepID=A0A918AMY5_9PSEU|nr:type VII secretion protein EccE [Saccharothrix coeruleofusca]GGP58225.1 type VII secretion protein EccE [Saccharothrix coeruleofusca]
MAVTTPHPGQPNPAMARAQAAAGAVRAAALRARRRTAGASLGALPVANLVVLETGVAIALILIAVGATGDSIAPVPLYIAGGIVLIALILAFTRSRGRWLTQWITLVVRYNFRSHSRTAKSAGPVEMKPPSEEDASVIGPDDPRVALLRLAVPDLVVAKGVDHERRPLGMAWHQGAWTAVLLVDPAPGLINAVGSAPSLPLGALAPCLEDRGVVLDAISVIWHCYPGSAALPSNSPALNSYLEVLGPLPAAARRTTWIAVRLDPRRCAAAIRERGGGVVGAHRALIGALSRVRNALESAGVSIRPLDSDELIRAGISAAELTSVAGSNKAVSLREKWSGVTAGGVGHASYAITGWPAKGMRNNLNALTGVRALSSTLAMSISPSGEQGQVGLRGLVRVSARTPTELDRADDRLKALADKLDITLTPLNGLQVSGLAATLPLGGVA